MEATRLRPKSINDLVCQLERRDYGTKNFLKRYSAYFRAFRQHFGCEAHSKECVRLIEKYGKDRKF